MFISDAYAQAAGGTGSTYEGFMQMLPLVAIFVVFYFLLLRPQKKKMEKHRQMIAQLRRGDRVLTQGGLFGTVTKVVDDTSILMEIAEGIRVRVSRPSITEVLAKTEPVENAGSTGNAGEETAPAVTEEPKNTSILSKILGKK